MVSDHSVIAWGISHVFSRSIDSHEAQAEQKGPFRLRCRHWLADPMKESDQGRGRPSGYAPDAASAADQASAFVA